MKTTRKTVNVETILQWANCQLVRPTMTQEYKKGICQMIEEILFSANRYRGFGNAYWLDDGFPQWWEDGKPDDKTPYMGEEYSRRYF